MADRKSWQWWAVVNPDEGPIIVRSTRAQARDTFSAKCPGDRIVRVTITLSAKKKRKAKSK